MRGLPSRRVLVVGDLILDRYVHGGVGRVSPEAPIVVFEAQREESRLGGALNVADNLRALGCGVGVAGAIGEDGFGRMLRDMLDAAGIASDGLISDATRPTTVKTRYVASNHQQVLRVDHERAVPLEEPVRARLEQFLDAQAARYDGVLVSDYGKGVLTRQTLERVIARARAEKRPVFVDPKGKDYTRYRGATLITPNRKEAEEATGLVLSDLGKVREAAQRLLDQVELEVAVITLGADGVFYRTRSGEERHVPTEAKAVFDVTGAGDTVISVLAWAYTAGACIEDAVRLANTAAGIVVGRFGAASVTQDEIAERLRPTLVREGKVLERSQLAGVVEELRAAGRTIAFTNGCFDILHPGHVDYLRDARAQGDVLIVGVNSDASIQRLKGPLRPICPLEDRLRVLAALEMVDFVVPFEEDTPLGLIQSITPDVLVKGQDWAGKVVGTEWVESHGGRVHLAKLVAGKSTTGIVERIIAALEKSKRPSAC
ncbi:MAG: D-glycero-beta-D-manno-heptose-7-phosphate kinase [Planctomycetes bacterium]|nr:D-glycero-beta-D-manno-heptose-7-phosphate kinase [Planctomycetota bacterium]